MSDWYERLRSGPLPDGLRVEAKASDRPHRIYLYDGIGAFGVSAKDFQGALQEIPDGADGWELHINSPGGDAFDGIAILNAIRQHPARVTVVVDGVAASAGSVIAMGGDEVVMAPHSQMMIHEAAGLCMGPAADMHKLGDTLDRMSNNLASIYAGKAGGDVDDWRAAMRDETWFSADEAVDAGLASRVLPATDEPPAEQVAARFDLSMFAHAGRAHAPAPVVAGAARRPRPTETAHAAPADGTATEEGAGMDPAKLREATGLPADASDEDVRGALVTAGIMQEPVISASTTTTDPPAAEDKSATVRRVDGTVVIDASAWDEREERIRRLEAAAAKRARDERDDVITAAVRAGKFPPARREHWARLWDADPEGTRQVLAGLASNVIPVTASGYSLDMDDETFDAEFAGLFPPKGV